MIAKINLKKIFIWIPAIIMACVIFGFSKQDGEESSGLSYKAADIILTISNKAGIVDYNESNKEVMIEKLQYPIRKMAHMTEYAILSVLIMTALLVDGLKAFKLPLTAWLMTTIFAATDEFHQLFVPGRCGSPKDVLIDSIGSIIGLLIYCLLIKAVKKLANK